MAQTDQFKMRQVILVALVTAVFSCVDAAEQCVQAGECADRFQARASIAHDEQALCEAVRIKLQCLTDVEPLCHPDQHTWIENEKETTHSRHPDCSGTAISASVILCLVLALLNLALTR